MQLYYYILCFSLIKLLFSAVDCFCRGKLGGLMRITSRLYLTLQSTTSKSTRDSVNHLQYGLTMNICQDKDVSSNLYIHSETFFLGSFVLHRLLRVQALYEQLSMVTRQWSGGIRTCELPYICVQQSPALTTRPLTTDIVKLKNNMFTTRILFFCRFLPVMSCLLCNKSIIYKYVFFFFSYTLYIHRNMLRWEALERLQILTVIHTFCTLPQTSFLSRQCKGNFRECGCGGYSN